MSGSQIRDRMEMHLREREAVPVNVLCFGPGPHKKDLFAKREQIADSARALPNTTVEMPEDLLDDKRFEVFGGQIDREELMADGADMILAVLPSDPSVTGLPHEVGTLGRDPTLRAKIRVLRPKGISRRGILHEGIQGLPSPQCFDYTPPMWERCEDMRAMVRRWIEAVRTEKYWASRRMARAGRLITSVTPEPPANPRPSSGRPRRRRSRG